MHIATYDVQSFCMRFLSFTNPNNTIIYHSFHFADKETDLVKNRRLVKNGWSGHKTQHFGSIPSFPFTRAAFWDFILYKKFKDWIVSNTYLIKGKYTWKKFVKIDSRYSRCYWILKYLAWNDSWVVFTYIWKKTFLAGTQNM